MGPHFVYPVLGDGPACSRAAEQPSPIQCPAGPQLVRRLRRARSMTSCRSWVRASGPVLGVRCRSTAALWASPNRPQGLLRSPRYFPRDQSAAREPLRYWPTSALRAASDAHLAGGCGPLNTSSTCVSRRRRTPVPVLKEMDAASLLNPGTRAPPASRTAGRTRAGALPRLQLSHCGSGQSLSA